MSLADSYHAPTSEETVTVVIEVRAKATILHPQLLSRSLGDADESKIFDSTRDGSLDACVFGGLGKIKIDRIRQKVNDEAVNVGKSPGSKTKADVSFEMHMFGVVN
jgi:hypothetical protein